MLFSIPHGQRIVNKTTADAIRDVLLYTGYYKEELNDDLPLRGSSNQHVYLFDSTLAQRYATYLQQPRAFDVEFEKDMMIVIGLLPSLGNGKQS